MTKNEFTLLYAVKRHGLLSCRKLKELTGLSVGFVSQTLRAFTECGWVVSSGSPGRPCSGGITEKGLEALKPYKVDNAVIMAAGMSTRFVPLSLEKPKGLLVVKGEVLIERQIEQLQAAGIRDIIIVLGYKKEAFFYLESKYEGLRLVINPEYNTKNNTHTLYLARNYLKNTYICSSDDYFTENPFDEYVYRSYYSAIHVTEKTSEWYMFPDAKGNISGVVKGGEEGDIMLGHAYWDRSFSDMMKAILIADHGVGRYDSLLWEDVLIAHLKTLPPMEIKLYPHDVIFEFDSLAELRAFDSNYVDHTHSRIMSNIASVFSCRESAIQGLKMIKAGLTNTSFTFEIEGKKYVYRHPNEGSEELVNRAHEKKALELARSAGADPTYVCMDAEKGWKISSFVDGARIPSYENAEDSKRVAEALRSLHSKGLSSGWEFDPWKEACRLEELLRSGKSGIADSELSKLKAAVGKCLEKCSGDGARKCFCHCDTYAGNWLLTDGPQAKTVLIDWEYAADADPGCDVGSYIMDSGWSVEEALRFTDMYYGEDPDYKDRRDVLRFHCLAYTAAVSYCWYLWGLHRESCGAVMGESLYNWRVMAKRFSSYLIKEYKL